MSPVPRAKAYPARIDLIALGWARTQGTFMSLIRTGILLAVGVMLLPVEERKQAQFTSAASRAVEETATFCERNPSTCAAGSELWALFLRKAEFGLELGARLVREQLFGAPATGAQTAERRQARHEPATGYPPSEPGSRPKAQYTMDYPQRWR